MPKKLILVVEDNFEVRLLLEEILKAEAYPVIAAENGQKAIELLRGLNDLPALIFLDINLPIMNGQEFLTEIQTNKKNERFSEIPVVILSAGRYEITGNVKAYIRKPPAIEQLFELAEKYAGE